MDIRGRENEGVVQQDILETITIITTTTVKGQQTMMLEVYGPGSKVYFHGYFGGIKKSH